jgi:hypothetical protein
MVEVKFVDVPEIVIRGGNVLKGLQLVRNPTRSTTRKETASEYGIPIGCCEDEGLHLSRAAWLC